jgi:TonB family protein
MVTRQKIRGNGHEAMETMLMRQITCCAAHRGRKLLLVLNLLTLLLFISVLPSFSQEHVPSERKLTTRIEPEYPEALKRLYIGGVVRVEVHILPSGTVESTELIGGNPVLGQSAMKAVKQWKYAPGKSKETLTVKLEFDPHR